MEPSTQVLAAAVRKNASTGGHLQYGRNSAHCQHAFFQEAHDYVGPYDHKNLNRVFLGTKAEPSAGLGLSYFHQLVESELYIDLHGGDMINLGPVVIYSQSGNQKVDQDSFRWRKLWNQARGAVTSQAARFIASPCGHPPILAEAGGQESGVRDGQYP
jgi:hypothetical protein